MLAVGMLLALQPAEAAARAAGCTASPQSTEGPYYVAGPTVRRDIREGRPGVVLTLRVTVVDATSCKRIKGAAVDIWHADAQGVYSGVSGNSGTFLRGAQPTDAQGVARFTTIYPGGYEGRAVHIHVKVRRAGAAVYTGQLYFAGSVSSQVFKNAAYSGSYTPNASDGIFAGSGSRTTVKVTKSGAGYAGAITLAVPRA
jgi:protocatechuate 3,4-dioxygenase beta subunit